MSVFNDKIVYKIYILKIKQFTVLVMFQRIFLFYFIVKITVKNIFKIALRMNLLLRV